MNKVTLVGNVVRDLELKEYKNEQKEGKYVKFTLAVNEYNIKQNERLTTFVEVIAFDSKAVILANNVGKGTKLAVEGKIRTGSYLNNNGEKKYTVDIVLTDFTFIDSKKKVVNEELSAEVPF